MHLLHQTGLTPLLTTCVVAVHSSTAAQSTSGVTWVTSVASGTWTPPRDNDTVNSRQCCPGYADACASCRLKPLLARTSTLRSQPGLLFVWLAAAQGVGGTASIMAVGSARDAGNVENTAARRSFGMLRVVSMMDEPSLSQSEWAGAWRVTAFGW